MEASNMELPLLQWLIPIKRGHNTLDSTPVSKKLLISSNGKGPRGRRILKVLHLVPFWIFVKIFPIGSLQQNWLLRTDAAITNRDLVTLISRDEVIYKSIAERRKNGLAIAHLSWYFKICPVRLLANGSCSDISDKTFIKEWRAG